MTPGSLVVPLADASSAAEAGGKGASLGFLARAGVAVPPGFVVTAGAFAAAMAALDPAGALRAEISALPAGSLAEIGRVAAAFRARVVAAPLPPAVAEAVRAGYAALGEGSPDVAVRSSATVEDSADASFAGLQDTYLWVLGEDQVVAKTRSCWASLYSVESVCYRRKHGLPEAGVAMGVVIQRMVDARSAGVMFTRSPTTGDRSVITIEGAWGLGSAVVSGEVTPDRWVVAKLTGEIPVRDISDKHIRQVPAPGGGVRDEETPADQRHAPCLSDAELQRLKDIARQAERHYGRPQDIEWAIEHGGDILLLQSRPETVWSAKEQAPAATAQANPLAHLMTVFGGRK